MLCKKIWLTLTINPRYVIQNTSFHIPLSNFYLFIYLFFVFLKKQTQTTQYGMYECNTMQILKTKENQNNKRRIFTKNIEMKYKDHVKNTQLD